MSGMTLKQLAKTHAQRSIFENQMFFCAAAGGGRFNFSEQIMLTDALEAAAREQLQDQKRARNRVALISLTNAVTA